STKAGETPVSVMWRSVISVGRMEGACRIAARMSQGRETTENPRHTKPNSRSFCWGGGRVVRKNKGAKPRDNSASSPPQLMKLRQNQWPRWAMHIGMRTRIRLVSTTATIRKGSSPARIRTITHGGCQEKVRD